MQEITLIILAAGLGSRFGGLKQVEEMGPNQEFLIDYSIYDAIKAGITKVVFVIKKENLEIFQKTIGKRIAKHITVEYAFQDLNDIKQKYHLPKERIKPLGTTHAVLTAKNNIKTPFIVINADDYYGKEAFLDAIKFLKETNYQKNGVVLYEIGQTLSINGEVRRGICKVNNEKLIDAIECLVIEKNNKIIAKPLNQNITFVISKDHPVNMNFFVLTPDIFPLLENCLEENIKKNSNNLLEFETSILEDMFYLSKNNKLSLTAIKTNSKWFGVTYRKDKEKVIDNINKMIEDKVYPSNLWQ